MHSTLDVNSQKKMTAEEILEEIEYPLENLQNLLFAFSKMKVDDGLKEQEFSHHQHATSPSSQNQPRGSC